MGDRVIDARLPRYHQLRDELADRIARRVWLPGAAIPTEAELAVSHGLAIGTVRKAIDALVADGVVERQQGRGTFVRRPSFDQSLFRFFRYQGDLDGHGIIPESRLLGRTVEQPIPAEAAEALGLRRTDRAIRIARLRLACGTPILLEDIWLPYARFEPMLAVAEAEIGPLLYPAYERLCGEAVARAEETLTIGIADAADARLLATEEKAPLVLIDRLAFGFDGTKLEWRRSKGIASKFRYKVDLR